MFQIKRWNTLILLKYYSRIIYNIIKIYKRIRIQRVSITSGSIDPLNKNLSNIFSGNNDYTGATKLFLYKDYSRKIFFIKIVLRFV